jgi:phosphoribosylaminoimidazolecarboxamide formyltransferase/IMP cyclohydrolase
MKKIMIVRALISVSDKTGIAMFAKGLRTYDVEILSTGGTAKAIREAGFKVTEVSDFTGFPEMLDGRIKTLHPKIHGGILGIRDNEQHIMQWGHNGIKPIDLVAVNLYPFEATVAKPRCTLDEAIENIDIGGPAMIRSAAKNHAFVTVITDPEDYSRVLSAMATSNGGVPINLNFELAVKAFALTAKYDAAIHAYLARKQEAIKMPARGGTRS